MVHLVDTIRGLVGLRLLPHLRPPETVQSQADARQKRPGRAGLSPWWANL